MGIIITTFDIYFFYQLNVFIIITFSKIFEEATFLQFFHENAIFTIPMLFLREML